MFGKSAFGSTGGFGQQQPTNSVFGQQPQQPQQQQTSAFGGFGATSTPSAFGAAPAATTGAFGQPAQQQSAFGAAPAAGGFGATGSAFGQARPSAFGSTTPSAFGAAQPAATSGFGGFGSTPSTSTFGSTTTPATGGLFGQRPATSAFGSVTPATNTFGQPQQTSAFGGGMGATGSAFGQQAATGVNQGTAGPDFSPTQDRDITTGVNNFFQTITAMPQYKNYSLEELRLQDYAQGRKTANAVGGGGAFGGGAASTTSAFGAPATTGFGQPAAATGGAFGQQTSAFGQPAAATGGAFGSSGGLFGQQPATTSAFGQPAAPATGGFGSTPSAFGQPAAATGGFGAAATGGAFGAAASKPFSFGSTPAPAATGFGAGATGGFGQPAAATGGFGQPAAQQQTGFGGFGQKPAATGGFGAATGGFGQPAAATGGFGAATGGFGAAATSKPASSFSFGATAPAPAAGGFGTGFGASAAPAAGGFGQPASGGLFGAAKPAAPTTSLFGNSTGATLGGATGGFGGFGATQPQQNTQTGGLFGQKPATTGLGGGLFGNNNTLGTGATTGGGFGGFGQQQQGGQFNLPAQGGLTSFGTNPLQQQQHLVATVDKNPYGNNPLFDLNKVANDTSNGAKSGPSAVALEGSSRKAHNHHYPISPRVVSKIKLRGFALPTGKSGLGNKKNTSGTLEGISDDAVLGVGAFAPRGGNKKILFDQNVDTANIVALVNNNKDSEKRKVVFDPNLELVATKENNSAPITSRAVVETNEPTIIAEGITSSPASVAIQNGYYISPTLETLKGMSKDSLKRVQNLIVGRKGYGEVKFEGAVDLSETALEDIMGNIVVIEEKRVVVYPNEATKAAPGTHLNVPALIRLDNCFAVDKNTGAPIKDPQHPRFKLFKEKLVNRPLVKFISYDDVTGEWYFKAESF